MRSGSINVKSGHLWYGGVEGLAWSSTAALTTSTLVTAYYLRFTAADVLPAPTPGYRWYGYPLRLLSNSDRRPSETVDANVS